METRQAVHYERAEAENSTDLRRHFVVDRVFAPGSLEATYTHYDRMLIAGVTSGCRLANRIH
jgi:4-deoxy-L-threo-5-hexosulose-uronate ketol-isomerase